MLTEAKGVPGKVGDHCTPNKKSEDPMMSGFGLKDHCALC